MQKARESSNTVLDLYYAKICRRVIDSREKSIFSSSGVARNFRVVGGIISTFFFGKTNLKLIEKQRKTLWGSGGMLPRKIFKNLLAVMAVLVFFE